MLTLCTNCIMMSRDITWIKKTYGEYASRKYHTKANNYILQYEDESDK